MTTKRRAKTIEMAISDELDSRQRADHDVLLRVEQDVVTIKNSLADLVTDYRREHDDHGSRLTCLETELVRFKAQSRLIMTIVGIAWVVLTFLPDLLPLVANLKRN
jgi:hypothetical protein